MAFMAPCAQLTLELCSKDIMSHVLFDHVRIQYIYIYIYREREGKCLVDNLVYQAEVVTEMETQTYVGLASTTLKLRYGNHKESFNNEGSKSKSTLSKHIWGFKKRG